MRKVQLISMIVLALTLLCMAINILITPLNDWVVRIAGILMLASVFAVAFSRAKSALHKK